MRCEYNDGWKVDYSNSLHISNGNEINVFMDEEFIPANIKHDLNAASAGNNCGEIRKIAQAVTDTVGTRACLADMDSKTCANF